MQRTAPLPQPGETVWGRPRAALAELQQRLVDPTLRPDWLWRAVWTPFWLWSDVPPAERPHRAPRAPVAMGLAGEAVIAGIDRVRRRLWLSHALAAVCRGVWLGLAFAALLMLLDLAGGPVFHPLPAAIVGGAFLLAGLVLAALSRPSRPRTARMLDRTFGLHERLATALDDLGLGVPGPGERAPVVYLQMADAANAIAALRGDRRLRPALPVREIVLIVVWALLLTTLAFLRGLGGGLPPLADAHVPPFTPAIERPADTEPSAAEIKAAEMAPTVQQVLDRADRSAAARHDLQALADALADHPTTRTAAEQIARGDYAAAGDELRQTAAQTSDLSQNARQGLSSDLDHAADQMRPQTTGLQEATSGAASGLRQGDPAASEGMRDLAGAVEQAGSQVVPQDELASQMRSAQQAQAQQGQPDASGSQSASAGAPSESSSASSAGTRSDPGNGADAAANGDASQRGEQPAQPGENGGEPGQSPSEQGGESGRGNTPGAADQPGAGENGQPGAGSPSGGPPSGQESSGDAAGAQQGAGAGTGHSGQPAAAGAGDTPGQQPASGADPADPSITEGNGAEGNPSALAAANEQMALPGGDGNQGVQTSANGGSAMRGSGAGVTAGNGFAVQGDVGEAGPDSNRVPAEHRDTVERYFSDGSGP